MKRDFGRFFLVANILDLLPCELHDHPATVPVELQRSFNSISPPTRFVPFVTEHPLTTGLAGAFGPLVAACNFIKFVPMETTS